MTNLDSEQHVIFGSGPLGLAVMRELRLRGKSVRLVNRSGRIDVPPGDGVEVVKGDATDPASVRSIVRQADVVYNCTNAPYHEWPEKFPPILNGVIDGVAGTQTKLIVADNLYMYGPTSKPLTEDLPYAAATRKGRTRAQMATTLLQAHQSGKVRAAIGRAADFFGPQVLDSAVGERVFANALAGKAADVMGNPDQPHTYTFIDDFARGLVTLGEHEEALGQAWHIPSAPTLTTRQFLALVYHGADTTPKMRIAGRSLLTLMGVFMPMLREMKEMLYEFEEPFVVDHSRFQRAFGSHVTPHVEAIRQTLAWYRQRSSTTK